jgi:hypothetical protein
MEESLLYFFSEIVTPQLYFGIQLVLSGVIYYCHLKRTSHFAIKAAASGICGIAILEVMPNIAIGWFTVTPLLISVVFVCLTFFLFQEERKKIIFCGMAAVITQFMGITTTDALRAIFNLKSDGWGWVLCCPIAFLAVFVICAVMFGRLMVYISKVEIKSYELLLVSGFLIIFCHALRIFPEQQMLQLADGRNIQISYHCYGIICSLLALWVLFSVNRENSLILEKELMEQMFQSHEQQQKYMKETIDLINLKCHDMKHQLVRIRTEKEGEGKDSALREMEDTILIYDHMANTGCEALDTVLTEKSLYCGNHQIDLQYMVDGKKLLFMKSADIYSLFGNALENAIEASVQEEDPQKRSISLQVQQKKAYLCIHMENNYTGTLHFADGMPVSSKEDKRYHGFGMKSMKYIVEKYSGHMSTEERDHCFCLNILIPLR